MYAKHFEFKKSTSNRTNTAVERIASNKEKTRVSGKIEWKKHKKRCRVPKKKKNKFEQNVESFLEKYTIFSVFKLVSVCVCA